jgi:hypothetical protein
MTEHQRHQLLEALKESRSGKIIVTPQHSVEVMVPTEDLIKMLSGATLLEREECARAVEQFSRCVGFTRADPSLDAMFKELAAIIRARA